MFRARLRNFQNVKLYIPILRLLRVIGIAFCVFFPVIACLADEKPRVSITIIKKAVGHPASKTVAGAENGRPHTLFATLENLSIRTLPEGTLRWTAVIRKYPGGLLKYSGTEPVKSLRSFQSSEIQCGVFELDAKPSVTILERDRIDYEMVYLIGEKEIARSVSTSNFAALMQKAESMTPEVVIVPAKPDDAAAPKKPADEKPASPAIIGAEKMPPAKPARPTEEGAKPGDAPTPPQQPFDFFNLGGKKPPAAK